MDKIFTDQKLFQIFKYLIYYILAFKIEALMRLLTLTLILPLSGCDIPFVPFF